MRRATSKTRVYLAKGYFQDEDKGCEASARTQVYLSKTKLSYRWVSSHIYSKSTIGVSESEWSKCENGESQVWEV